MTHVVSFSGGIGSWAAAKRVAATHGTDDLVLVFTDTMIEDPDLYRFIEEAAANVGGRFVRLADGRDPWQVFRDKRMIGNSRIDPCSEVLKRKLFERWRDAAYTPNNCVIYLGIDWTERHRIERVQQRQAPWRYEAPLCDPPMLFKGDALAALAKEGIEAPRLYRLGFKHNNCGGFCVKAGIGQFAHLLRTLPEVYAHHEAKEQEMREFLDRDVAILRTTRGDETVPLTLRDLRKRVQSGDCAGLDLYQAGGCGCFLDGDDDGGNP